MKTAPLDERIIVALDLHRREQMEYILSCLSPHCAFYKVGLELFLAGGWSAVEEIKEKRGAKVMLDLKFYDIPRTTKQAVRQLADKGIDYATVHAAAVDGALAGKEDDNLKILAITMLTSVSDINNEVKDTVLKQAERALRAGCDGLVASAREAAALRAEFGEDFILVTPGIRNSSAKEDDQKRTATAEQAAQAGVDHLVIGRPIVQSADPLKAFLRFQEDINEGKTG